MNKLSYNGGKRIGYFKVRSEIVNDPYGFINSPIFMDVAFSPNGEKYIDHIAKPYAAYGDYLKNKLNCESVIIG